MGWAVGASLSLCLVVVVHFTVGWGPLLAPWTRVQAWVLLVGVFLVVGSYAVRTVRIHNYFRPATSDRFTGVFRLVLIHNLLNNLLPMRTGEASFPVLMASRFSVPYSRSIPALLYLRALDLHFVLLLGGIILLLDRTRSAWALLIPLTSIPYGFFRLQQPLGRRLAAREGRIASLGRGILDGLPASERLFWTTWLWTAVNWSAKLLVLAWILMAFSPMPFPAALVGATTGELSSVLPVHGIAGAGTYEAGILAGLIPLGIELEAALKGAVNIHLFVLGVAILAGVLAALLPIRRNGSDEGPIHS
jgi:uncharacterized membrane protein YbhN (UPF0104 family)